MNKQPLLLVFLSLVAGIFLQDCFHFHSKVMYGVLALCIVCLSFFIFTKRLFYKEISIAIAFLTIGVVVHFWNQKQPPKIATHQRVDLVFKVNKKINSTNKNRRYIIEVLNTDARWNALLSLPKEEAPLDYHHYYQTSAIVRILPKPSQDYQFNFQKYMARREVFFQLYPKAPLNKWERKDLTIAEKIKALRNKVLNSIESTSIITPSNKSLIKAIILADRTDMEATTVKDFTQTGLVHILAISGSHMVLIFAVVYYFLSLLLTNKRFVILGSLGLIWLFCVFIDYGNSVVRSSIMITIYYVYVLLQRRTDLLHSMSLSGLIILGWNTQELFDVGFLLSFMAVFGIYWLNRPIQKYFPKTKSKILKYFLGILSITLSAQIATLPLVIYFFNQFSATSLVSNLIVIPVAEVVIIFSFFIVIIIGLGFDIAFLNHIYNFLSTIFLRLVNFFASLESWHWHSIPMNLVEVIILFFFLYYLRGLMLKSNLKHLIRLIFILELFFMTRLIMTTIAYQKDEIMVHQLYKDKVFSVKEKDSVRFWIPENVPMERVQRYIIEPYKTSRRVGNHRVFYYPSSTKTIVYNNTSYSLE